MISFKRKLTGWEKKSQFMFQPHSTSTFPSIISLRVSNLFLIELILKDSCLSAHAKHSQYYYDKKNASQWYQICQRDFEKVYINLFMLLAKILLPFLFKRNLLLFKQNSFIAELSTNMNLLPNSSFSICRQYH